METSILKTIRSMLDMDPDEEVYNNDILIHINSAIMTLVQLGVGPKDGFAPSSNLELPRNSSQVSAALETTKPSFGPTPS